LSVIRKIILFIIVALVVTWLAGAHIIKNRLIMIAEDASSDNIKFSYQDTKISGFPFSWQVTFISPKLTITDQKSLREIFIPSLNTKFDYSMQGVVFNSGQIIYCNDIQGPLVQEYQFISDQDISVNAYFTESLYFMDSALQWKDFISAIKFDLSSIKMDLAGREIFTMSDIQVRSRQEQNDFISSMQLKLVGNYSASASYLNVSKAHLLVDLSYLINNHLLESEGKIDFDRKLKLSKIKLYLDNASLDLSGVLNLTRSSLPHGELDVSLVQYHDVINAVVPDDFMFSADYIKKIIAKATLSDANNDSNNVEFKVRFSDKGISVGTLNLLELKVE